LCGFRGCGANEMDQTALLSANSIAGKFEFEIRRESIHAADWTEQFFGRINRPTDVAEMRIG